MSTADPSRSFEAPVTGSTSGATQSFPTYPEDVPKGGNKSAGAKSGGAKAAETAERSAPTAPVPTTQGPNATAKASGGGPGGPRQGAVAKGAPAKGASGKGAPARPAAKAAAAGSTSAGRRVRLTLARIDPWSALKMSFLLSVALGIALVVAVAALWLILSAMGVFDQVNSLVGKIIQDSGQPFDIMDFIGFGRVVSLTMVIAVVDVFLWTAIATIGSFIYNVSSSLVGGLHLTLTDD